MAFENLTEFLKNPYGFVKDNPNSGFKYFLIIIGWAFQGIFYADKTERYFKIVCDLLLIIGFFIFFQFILSVPTIFLLILSIVIGHTINWLINVGIWCSLRGKYGIYVKGVGIGNKEVFFDEFLIRVKKTPSIKSVLIYGSYARGTDSMTSDIDIRVIRRSGIINAIQACFFGLQERVRALIKKVPLDLCVIDNRDHLKKMDPNEQPKIIFDPDKIFGNKSNNLGR